MKKSLHLGLILFGSILIFGGLAAASTTGESICMSGNLASAYDDYKYSCTSNVISECSSIYNGEYLVGFSNEEGKACECVSNNVKSFLQVQSNEALKQDCEKRVFLIESISRK